MYTPHMQESLESEQAEEDTGSETEEEEEQPEGLKERVEVTAEVHWDKPAYTLTTGKLGTQYCA